MRSPPKSARTRSTAWRPSCKAPTSANARQREAGAGRERLAAGRRCGHRRTADGISAYKVRGLVRKYLNRNVLPDRERTYSYIKQESGGEPAMVAKLLAHMKPPAIRQARPANRATTKSRCRAWPRNRGHVLRATPARIRPYRLYPTIVTLHGAGDDAETADRLVGGRLGGRRADRPGHEIRLHRDAPAWTEEHQKPYGYSAREHAAVLNSLRDACRRFSIDTDRVFLSGYSMGGDAAWDMGLAHPDLWAGVIPIVAQSDRYCTFYWENARYVPFYLVAGEIDGKMIKNAPTWTATSSRLQHDGGRVSGRGHEDFYDEILRMFDWMGHFHRNFFPREFTCETMRSVGQFLLVGRGPGAAAAIGSIRPTGRRRPARSRKGECQNDRQERAKRPRAAGARATVWLSPKCSISSNEPSSP